MFVVFVLSLITSWRTIPASQLDLVLLAWRLNFKEMPNRSLYNKCVERKPTGSEVL
jgi:hypothetical protein